ncbi:hypothetical protein EZS27_002882 [termite gut metagenome]|uniref:FAS1 domain-containing protein n=1 Tax=termite gut metagenome TaxID=433724 RepID=A0A5J4SVA4_9ZZZZ
MKKQDETCMQSKPKSKNKLRVPFNLINNYVYMKKKIRMTCAVCSSFLMSLLMTGCTLFGLDLQEDYDYQHSYYDTEVNTDVWTFMNSRKDIFSGMLNAIEYVKDVDPSIVQLYQNPNSTYLLLTNTALTDLSSTSSYWSMNKLFNPDLPWENQYYSITFWSQVSKQTVIDLLRYHVIKGLHGYQQLNSTPTWFDTYAAADTAKVNLYLSNGREGYLYINNYVGVPSIVYVSSRSVSATGAQTTTNTTIAYTGLYPRTPNLIATNGIIHVVDRWFFPPTRGVLAQ